MLTVPKAASLLNRPHLIRESDAGYWAQRLLSFDPHALARRGNTLNIMARLSSLVGRPAAMDDEDREPRKEPTKPKAYEPKWLGKPDGEGEFGYTVKDGIALFSVNTPLVEHGFGFCGTWFHGYDSIEAAFEEMDADTRVKGIFSHWDSPGGVVAPGIYELTTFLQNRRAASTEGAKPTWAYCDLAASAAYWLPCQEDHLVAPNVGVVGSIGAVYTHVSYAGALDQDGVKVTPVQFGKFKTAGAGFKDLTDEELGHLQAVIDDLGEDFLAAVESGRGSKLTAEMARATEARVFQAQHRDPEHSGLARGFVDAIMTQRDAFAALVAETRKGSVFPIPAKPAGNPAARAAQPTESPMTKKLDASDTAALGAAMAADPSLKEKMQKLLDEHEENEAADEDEDVEDENEEKEPAAEEEDEDTEASAPVPAKKPKAGLKVDAAIAQAVLALPEAKGREALAQRLAFKPGMTVAEAKADLAAAPKANRLRERATDVDVSGNGGNDTRSEARKLADRNLANAGFAPSAK